MAQITDPDDKLVAERAYEQILDAGREAARIQAGYGKWLIATLTAVHLGAIYFVGLDSNPHLTIEAKIPALRFFVSGLLLILLSGLIAFINWGLIADFYRRWAMRICSSRICSSVEKSFLNPRRTFGCSVPIGPRLFLA